MQSQFAYNEKLRDRNGPEHLPSEWAAVTLMLNAHLPTENRRSSVGVHVPNADPIVGVRLRYSADSKFESAL